MFPCRILAHGHLKAQNKRSSQLISMPKYMALGYAALRAWSPSPRPQPASRIRASRGKWTCAGIFNKARVGVGNSGASLQALSGYTKAIKISKQNQARGGIDSVVEVMSNCDRGKPSTIKHRRHKVLPNADNKTLSKVAPIKAQALGTLRVSKEKNSHDRPQANNAGNGQFRIFMGKWGEGESLPMARTQKRIDVELL